MLTMFIQKRQSWLLEQVVKLYDVPIYLAPFDPHPSACHHPISS